MTAELRTNDADFDLVIERCLGAPDGERPVVVIGGSVAVGKSSFAERMRFRLLQRDGLATVVGTDGFLFSNNILVERGLLERKGFPETYDVDRLVAFLHHAKTLAAGATVPIYSHQVFDVIRQDVVALGDVVIVEGVNALRSPFFEVATHRVYLDAPEVVIRAWFAERFLRLIDDAERDETSFYRRFVVLDSDGRTEVVNQVWDGINGPNLREHVLPTMMHADTIVHLNSDHSIDRLTLRSDKEPT